MSDVESLQQRSARLSAESAVLLIVAGQSWSSHVVNISSTGVLMQRPPDWPRGLLGTVLVELPAASAHISLRARVVRESEEGLALQFTEIKGPAREALAAMLGPFADLTEY